LSAIWPVDRNPPTMTKTMGTIVNAATTSATT
jgi:hypothetical protein